MKTQIKNKIQFVLFIMVAVVLTFSWSVARGDDLNPPTYRGNPLSVNAEWQFAPGTTILSMTNWNSVDDSDPSTYLYPNFTPTPQIIPNNGVYQFQVPNWVDQMPVKYMRVQLTYLGTTQLPINLFSEGLDGTNLIQGTITATSSPIVMSNGVYQYFDFEFHPNLDFERINVQLPLNGVLSQVVVDTVSTVPEPATLLLLGLGSMALLKRSRKNS